ncbi:MAG: hypothetical protein A3C27_00520 [Candidatus Levybacteria bacterium RIFCSPHIGHO2_02_FULL_39_36]|nr:MAG: hypothetical protein UT20_C0001G0029 [Candidatus Levybacteria bacterium GW2011_GWA1_39_11]KKR25320.1 MAG: hypothetical protein UT56_C0001G0051 [Candidatus Levybacteria bacterium GW2011_GWB1_39_7]KKR27593.1 MAG: hypothetical protein UT57_C0001G0017 [Microgenomates group bacterium GW2011_GWC1_39_7]KKR50433.1 MAG: hypothetical protein UT85_C0002G0041 [Candidatus Levybacteria bacterium GW2011_GWA2_40_16]OGH14479.1 MAG: hypothetical protein A2689_00430 [Candidatus Levybacteria bacterium RIFC
MKTNINLIGQTRAQKKRLNIFFIASLSVFLIIFIISLFFLVYSLMLKARAQGLLKKENSLRSQITVYSAQKEKLLIVGERLGNLRKVISSRGNIDTRAETILSVIPSDFNIEALMADSKVVTIKISSPDLTSFDTLLEERIPNFTKNNSLKIARVNVDYFSQKKDDYSLSLSFHFAPQKLK